MASIKVKYRPTTYDGRRGIIYYQIIYERKIRQYSTNYKIYTDEWDEKHSIIKLSQPTSPRQSYILALRERLNREIERWARIEKQLNTQGLPYTADDIIKEFKRRSDEDTLFGFMKLIIGRLKHNGKIRTSETYTAAMKSFRKFLNTQIVIDETAGNSDIMIDCITSEIMEAFQAWHKSRGNSPNTISFYLRILRAVYHRAIDQGITENRYPFRHVYTGVEKTVKRAITLNHIKKVKNLDLTLFPKLDFARDMFLMSFYLRGMSFIDMIYLKKTDLINGYIIYRRRKTGQQLTIKWTHEMQSVINKYPEYHTKYLLPIIRTNGVNERSAYHNMGYSINYNLKKVAQMAGIDINLTMYVARHSWASAAKSKGIPISIISEGLGHDNELTTRIYLASLDTSIVDNANSIILNSLK